MDYATESLRLHGEWGGKIEVISRVPVTTREELSLAYTPGVAAPCLEIEKDLDKSYTLTRRHNLVLVVTDGSAVLGLGNIGPEAGMPVMEGKCVLFKELGGVDAFPLCVKSQEVDTIVETVYQISGSFGGVNLEDIAAPRCFEIEEKLKERCDIPIFHDDQHGTAIVVAAALTNALKVAGKRIEDITLVLNGVGAAGTAIYKLLKTMGLKKAWLCDKFGIMRENDDRLDYVKRALAAETNPENLEGTLADALVGADVFIGVSAPNLVTPDMVRSMNDKAILFPMANPTPEIMPDAALEAGALIVGTGRSDFKNQINNIMAFPGVFRGALDVRASEINDAMKKAAVRAIAGLVSEGELSPDYIMPSALDPRVYEAVAEAVRKAARESGAARV